MPYHRSDFIVVLGNRKLYKNTHAVTFAQLIGSLRGRHYEQTVGRIDMAGKA